MQTHFCMRQSLSASQCKHFFFLQVLCSSFVCMITVTNISVLFFVWLFCGSHLSEGLCVQQSSFVLYWVAAPCYVWAHWLLLVYKAGLAQTTIQYVYVDHVDGPHAPWYLIGGLRSFVIRITAAFNWLRCSLSTRDIFHLFLPLPQFIPAFVCLPDDYQPSIFLTMSSSLVEKVPSRGNSLRWVYGLWILWSSEPVMR